jgi:hypothetical protein
MKVASRGRDAVSDDADRPGASLLMRPVWRQDNFSSVRAEA